MNEKDFDLDFDFEKEFEESKNKNIKELITIMSDMLCQGHHNRIKKMCTYFFKCLDLLY